MFECENNDRKSFPLSQQIDNTTAIIRFSKNLSNFIVDHFNFLAQKISLHAAEVSSGFENQIEQVTSNHNIAGNGKLPFQKHKFSFISKQISCFFTYRLTYKGITSTAIVTMPSVADTAMYFKFIIQIPHYIIRYRLD